MEVQLPVDVERCIICGLKSHIPFTKKPTEDALSKIINTAKSRKNSVTFGKYSKFIDCLASSEVDILKTRKFHKSCYNLFCFHKLPPDIAVENIQYSTSISSENADLDIISFIKNHLNEKKYLTMNEVALKYCELMKTADSNIRQIKPELKKLITSQMENVLFLRPNTRESEVLVTISIMEDMFSKCVKSDTEHLDENAAYLLRQRLLNQIPWTFSGDFGSYSENAEVHKFFKQVIGGKKEIYWNESINKDAAVLSQLIYQMCRTDRQITYNSENQKTQHETPLSVGMALSSHSYNRSKHSVEELHQLQFGISYFKVMNLENDIALSVTKSMDSSGGYTVPLWLQKNVPMFFAIDNVDFKEDTSDGKNTLHGTLLVVYQKKSVTVSSTLSIERNKSSKSVARLECNLLECQIPQPSLYTSVNSCSLEYNRSESVTKHNRLWMCSFMNPEINNIFPITWSAFNSSSSAKKNELTNVGMIAPILRLPPTNYSALLTSIMRAKHINSETNPGSITVISFDLQLFDMAMKLWMSDDFIRKNFLFRPGELHTVFWALAALGDYIEGRKF